MKAQTLVAAVLIGNSSYTMAADAGMPIEGPPVEFNWSGGYVGGQVGYSSGSTDQTFLTTLNTTHPDPEGWFGGAYVGYNYQFENRIVLGIEGDFAWGDMQGDSLNYDPSGNPIPLAFVAYSHVDWNAAVRARMGYGLSRFMPFIAGGLALSRASWSNTFSGAEIVRMDKTFTGWTIGGGVEYAFTDDLIGRVEYRYSDFGTETDPETVDFQGRAVGLKANDIRFGIAYKF